LDYLERLKKHFILKILVKTSDLRLSRVGSTTKQQIAIMRFVSYLRRLWIERLPTLQLAPRRATTPTPGLGAAAMRETRHGHLPEALGAPHRAVPAPNARPRRQPAVARPDLTASAA
jgi:hypothetical protein